MSTGHIVAAIIAAGVVTGLGIYLESRLRNARATRQAERRRHEERNRRRGNLN
jgi:uncharacterized membrane protein YciS (DUF1049 family)